MKVIKIEDIYIEQSECGRQFANEYEKVLKKENVFIKRSEDTQFIKIKAGYNFILGESEKV